MSRILYTDRQCESQLSGNCQNMNASLVYLQFLVEGTLDVHDFLVDLENLILKALLRELARLVIFPRVLVVI